MVNEALVIDGEQVRKLAQDIKREVQKIKGNLFLGMFNGKIPVLLNASPGFDRMMFSETPEQDNPRYRIHFEDPNSEWWISLLHPNEKIFTFHIRSEFKKILAKSDDPEKFARLKKTLMTSLIFSIRDGNTSKTYKLILDNAWIQQILGNY